MHLVLSAPQIGEGGGGGGEGESAAYLNETPHWFAISGHNVLLISVYNLVPFCSGQIVLRQVQVDLVSIKVSIKGIAVGIVHADNSLTLCHKWTAVDG